MSYLLDLGSLGTNQEKHFFRFHRNLAYGEDRFSKFIENSIGTALLDESKRDLGIDLRITRWIQQSGVVLEPETDFDEIAIERVLGTASRFVISGVPIEFFLCLYQHGLTA
jgi:hypothetical protein